MSTLADRKIAWFEGFDDYPGNNAGGIGVYATWIHSGNWDGGLTAGRFGNRAWASSFADHLTRLFPSTTEVAFGIAVRLDRISDQGVGDGSPFIAVQDTQANEQFEIRANDAGQVSVWGGGTRLFTCVKPMLSGTWHFLEFEVVLDSVAGRISAWIDGEPQQAPYLDRDPSYTGKTKWAGADFARFQIYAGGGGAFNPSKAFDDVYMCIDNATRLGECRALLMQITNADDQAQWTKLAGASNASQVMEQQVDGDATYNSSNTVGQEDRFLLQDLTGNPTQIFAFQLTTVAKKDDAGTRTIAPVITIGGTRVQAADAYQTTDYTFNRQIMEKNPVTAAPWTKADFTGGNIKVGYKLTL